MPQTILFSTPWTHPADGWAVASRAYARVMHGAGYGVYLRDWQRPLVELDDEVRDELAELLPEMRLSPLSPVVLHVFSCALLSADRMLPILDAMLENRARIGTPQAFYCVFERRGIEPELAEKFRELDGVFVQCRMNERVLREAGVDATLIRYPFFDDDPHLELDKPAREPRRFYYIGRFEPRKAAENVVRAFLRAFAPGEAELTVKTSPIPHSAPHPSAWQVVDAELLEPDVVRNGWSSSNIWQSLTIVEGHLSREEMLRLHAEEDVYVSASRGEGLELPAWEAKLSGRRLIVTASGGPEDFLDPEVDICIPATGLVPADPSYKWGEGAAYVDYRLEDLVEAMQVARGQHACGTRTWPGWEKHRAPRVARSFSDWVEATALRTAQPRLEDRAAP